MGRNPLSLERLEARDCPSASVNFANGILSVTEAVRRTAPDFVQFLPVAGQPASVTLAIDGTTVGTFTGVTQVTYTGNTIAGDYVNGGGDYIVNTTTIPLVADVASYGAVVNSTAAGSNLTLRGDVSSAQDTAGGTTITTYGSRDTIFGGANDTHNVFGNETTDYKTAPGGTVTTGANTYNDILMVGPGTVVNNTSARDLTINFFPTGAAPGSGGFVVETDPTNGKLVDFFAADNAATDSFSAVGNKATDTLTVSYTTAAGTTTITQPLDQVEYMVAFGGAGSLTATDQSVVSASFYGGRETAAGSGSNNLQILPEPDGGSPYFALEKQIGPGGNFVLDAYAKNEYFGANNAAFAAGTVSFGGLSTGFNAFNVYHQFATANTLTGFVFGRDITISTNPEPGITYADAGLIDWLLAHEG